MQKTKKLRIRQTVGEIFLGEFVIILVILHSHLKEKYQDTTI